MVSHYRLYELSILCFFCGGTMASSRIRTYRDAVVIITGGASGIGRALACESAARGAQVVIADLQAQPARAVADQIRAAGGRATAVQVDVTDSVAVDHLVRDAAESHGRIDYLFNNAGIVIGGTINDLSVGDWNRVIDVNLRGVVNGVQVVYPIMRNQGFGHVVNTASMAGLMPHPMNIPYTATKHAVVGLSQSLRAEVAHLGIRVSAICPGVIRTPILDGGRYGAFHMKIPHEKLGSIWEGLKPMSPDVFAKKVLNAIAKNKAIIIEPMFWKIIWWLNRLSPALGVALARRSFTRLRKEFDL